MFKKITTQAECEDEVGIYPGDEFNFIALTKNEIYLLSDKLPFFYIKLIDLFADSMCSDFNISKDVLKTVLRAPVMSLTHSFFEKTFRIQKICQSYKCLKVPAIEKNKTPETIEQLNEIIVSKQYNLLLINSIAKTFSDFDEYSYTGEKLNKKKYKYKNNLFELQSGLNLFARFVAKLDCFTNMLPALGRFPVLTLANAEPAFSKNFFYWFNFKKVNMSWVYTHVDLDIKLRQKIFCDGLVESQLIKIFSSFFKFSDPHCRKLTCAFLENFMFHFPKQLFEGLNQNINFASRILCGFNNKNLICSTGLSDTKTIFLLSAARKNGFNIVNIQHGGHYGYLKGTSFPDKEWAVNDIFISWGWTILPDHPAIKKLTVDVLPSPWLSERKNYWKKFEYQSKREFDILWMPQMMKLYTEPVQAASSISLDVLPEFSESMRNLIKEATQRGIRVYCKPYNRETVDLMRNLYDSIQSIGGKYFKSDVADSKGLTFALVNKANIVLWDQPGTGFLECLVSGIPTMVLWERIYCIEELWAKIDFKELKDLGIIHDNLDSFFLELEKFQKNKKAWINDVRRQQAILSFCKKYAHTDEGWCADWRKYLATKKKLQ